ncbi:MAG: hypothetical protein HY901_16050 [Deltaproteobacteria bacterium]|nr:hypothetical protein [Deltaproteobacteria bacterium]
MKRLGIACAAALLLLPLAARAQEGDKPSGEEVTAKDVVVIQQVEDHRSSRSFYLEINGGRFTPEIDEQPGLTGTPYQDVFGNNGMWIFGGEFDFELWSPFGTFSLGLAADYATVYGHGIVALSGEESPDLTSLKTVPIRALAVYRFDWLARELGIPLIPFGKAGLAYTIWWITNGEGSISTFQESSGKALGGKWGYELAGGLALELNFIDRTLSREFDQEFGVNSVTLQAQYMRVTADNFGGEGLDLTANTWMFGLGFEF